MTRTARSTSERRATLSGSVSLLLPLVCSLLLLFYLIQHRAALGAIANWLSGR